MDVKGVLTLIKGILLGLAPKFKKADSIEGNKEVLEAVDATLKLSVVFAKLLKDGAQVSDLAALWQEWSQNQELQDAVKLGLENAGKIPAEVKDFDLGEGLELTAALTDHVEPLVAAFRGGDEDEAA